MPGWLRPEQGSSPLCVVRSDLRGDQDALPKQVKAGATVHRTFDRLQAGDLAFGGAGTPRHGNGGGDGLPVALETVDEAIEQGATGRFYPGSQSSISLLKVRTAFAQQIGEGDGQRTGTHQFRCDVAEVTDENLLPGTEPIRRCRNHACTAPE
jgi:hypothetical protein